MSTEREEYRRPSDATEVARIGIERARRALAGEPSDGEAVELEEETDE